MPKTHEQIEREFEIYRALHTRSVSGAPACNVYEALQAEAEGRDGSLELAVAIAKSSRQDGPVDVFAVADQIRNGKFQADKPLPLIS